MNGKTAQIDLEGMARLVRGLEDVATYVPGIRNEFNRTLHRFSLPTDTTSPLLGVAGWAADVLPGVRRRLALARAVEAQECLWGSPVVTIDELALLTTSPAEAERLGAETARALRDGRGAPDPALLARFDELSGDPYFAAGFARAVSPDDLAVLVRRLSAQRPQYDGRDGQTLEQYEASTAWYGRAIEGISRTLGTATHGTGDLALPSDYADGWVRAITADPQGGGGLPGQAAVLGLLLASGGRFEERFIGTVAEGVYDYERAWVAERGGALWRPRTAYSEPGQGIHDPTTGGWFVDPLAGVMSALGRNPVAAQDFFSRGGTTTVDVDGTQVTVGERLQYLVVQRTWEPHLSPGAGLGLALEAASTVFRGQGQRGQVSARLAGETFVLIGAETGKGDGPLPGDRGWQMHEGMRVHVSRMLASYGTDVFRVAMRDKSDQPPGAVDGLGSGPLFSETDMPYGVRFDKEHLQAILGTLGERQEDLEPALVGLMQASNMAIATGLIRARQEHPEGPVGAARDLWSGSLDSSSSSGFTGAGDATSFFLAAARRGAEADEAARKEQAELIADALNLVADAPFIPDIKDDWLKLGVGEAKGWALDGVRDVRTDADGRYAQAERDADDTLRENTMDLLLRLGYLEPEAFGEGSFTGGAPPPEAVRTEGGVAVGFDFESEEFWEWYDRSPMYSLMSRMLTNYRASLFLDTRG